MTRKDTLLPLHRRYPIGAGSSIALLGQWPLDEALLGDNCIYHQGTQLYYLAEFAFTGQPAGSVLAIHRMQQEITLGILRKDQSFRPKPDYERLVAALDPIDRMRWPRMIFRVCEMGEVQNAERFSRALSSKLSRMWSLIEHSEFTWRESNSAVQGKYPILPQDIFCDAPRWGFSHDDVDAAAEWILRGAKEAKENVWPRVHVYSATPTDVVKGLMRLEQLELLERIDQYDYHVRERLIVRFFRAALGEAH